MRSLRNATLLAAAMLALVAEERFATAPGQGLKPAQVAGLAQFIQNKGMRMDPISGTMSVQHVLRDFLLLTDGSIREGWPSHLPLEDFDQAASKLAEPKRWGTFTAEGEDHTVTWSDGRSEKLKLSFVVLASPGERVDGYFYRMGIAQSGAGTGASSFSSGWRGILLRPDGRFETGSGGSSDYQNARGTVSAGNANRAQGSYRLSGSALELIYDDGHTERRQFAFSSAKKDWIYLNGQRLLKRK